MSNNLGLLSNLKSPFFNSINKIFSRKIKIYNLSVKEKIDLKFFFSYLIYNQINLLFLTNEIILTELSYNSIFKFCKNHGIKLFIINIKYDLENENNSLKLFEIKKINCKSDYKIEIDFLFDDSNTLNIINKNTKLSENIFFSPLLSDYFAQELFIKIEKEDKDFIFPEMKISLDYFFSLIKQGKFDKSTTLSQQFAILKKQKFCSFQLVYKLSPEENFYNKTVAEFRLKLGKKLAKNISKTILNSIDYVLPVPNTGIFYAMGISNELNIPYLQALVKNKNVNERSFQLQNTEERKVLIWNKIIPIKHLIENKNVIVCDEAIFTGTTLKLVCSLLRECNVKQIHLVIPTPPCRHRCKNYMLPDRAMLLEYVREDDLCKYFDVDSITFQKKSDFKDILSEFNAKCIDCFE